MLRHVLRLLVVYMLIQGGAVSGKTQEMHGNDIVAWSPDGNLITSIDSQSRLSIWNASTSELLLQIPTGEDLITSIAWNATSSRIAGINPRNGVIHIWNVETGATVTLLQGEATHNEFASVAWSYDGSFFASASLIDDSGLPLRIWQVDGDSFVSLFVDFSTQAYDLNWSPSDDDLAVATLWGIAVFDDVGSAALQPRPISEFKLFFDWSPTGETIAAVDVARSIELINVSTGQNQLERLYPSIEQGIAAIQWSPDGNLLAFYTVDGSLQIWDAITGYIVEGINLYQSPKRNSISWSPFGGRLVVAGTPISTTQGQVEDIARTLLNSSVQIVVPDPSLERLQSIAALCSAPLTIPDAAQADQLTDFVAQVEALPAESIPPACAADLIAVAEAIQAGQ